MGKSAEDRSVGAPAAPEADAARVAAIRNSLDPRDQGAVQSFGERARREVGASVERLHAEVKGRELQDLSDTLRKLADTAQGLEPAMLTPTGMASLFGGRRRRLNWFRGRYDVARRTLDELVADMRERAQRIERKSHALNTLHEQARSFILELDAHVAAGRARGAELMSRGADKAAETSERLKARLSDLETLRSTAVQQLPLVRLVQNVDAPVGEAVEHAAQAVETWKADWADRLGMTLDPRLGIRPDEAGLAASKAALLQSIEACEARLKESRDRRREAEAELEDAARTVRR
jgi:uncharacterized protein YaaN involved in tellurite resistance